MAFDNAHDTVQSIISKLVLQEVRPAEPATHHHNLRKNCKIYASSKLGLHIASLPCTKYHVQPTQRPFQESFSNIFLHSWRKSF